MKAGITFFPGRPEGQGLPGAQSVHDIGLDFGQTAVAAGRQGYQGGPE